MIPQDPSDGKSLYLPRGVRVMPYEPRKKRRRCGCRGRGEWRWNGEIICSRCLIEVKLADQKEKVENFIRMSVLTAKDNLEWSHKLAMTIDTDTDPPKLKERGYWNLANVIVITHRFANPIRPR